MLSRCALFEDKRIRTAWDEEKEEWYFSIVDVVGVLTDQPDARHASTYWAVLKKRLNEEGIRTAWDEEKEEWYFSIVDVVGVLTDQPDARHASTYWAVLKKRLNEEGTNELLTDCKQFIMTAADGKKRLTDVADTEQLLRIIQSIPSPKAEPFKMWLAQVGRERIEETIDPELTIERALETYLKKGYTREWINQRLQAIQVRKELTDEWDARGVQKGVEYAILTDEISRAIKMISYLSLSRFVSKRGKGKLHRF